ncbi:MAG TPA: hypothetical protein VGR35_09560 [Tepidisphaeraceae bacterium]|nr:hypothetical protein [Tepidisphaeraceae bacterium]
MALTREQILQRRKVTTEVVPAPELGDGATLNVRRLSAREFMELTEQAKTDSDNAYAYWIAATVVDDTGEGKVFTVDDAKGLVSELDITLVERLTDAAQRLNISKKADGPNPQARSADSPSS